MTAGELGTLIKQCGFVQHDLPGYPEVEYRNEEGGSLRLPRDPTVVLHRAVVIAVRRYLLDNDWLLPNLEETFR